MGQPSARQSGGQGVANPLSRRYAQDLRDPAAVLPFIRDPRIVHMGLHRLPASAWLQGCSGLSHYHHNKLSARRILGERVFVHLPVSLPAQRELAGLMARHLVQDHRNYQALHTGDICWHGTGQPLRWPGVAAAVASGEPLWATSLWVADDLCILLPGAHGYELAAASLAAPSYWRLEDKIGRPLSAIHQPVPGFREKLGDQVARFFDHLLPEYPVWRGNWSVVDSANLLQRGEGDDYIGACGPDKAEAEGRGLYLRIERQSLRRLPVTGAVVFSIRVMINPLSDLLEVPAALSQLKTAVDAMSPEESRYKSIAPLRAELDNFFSAHLFC